MTDTTIAQLAARDVLRARLGELRQAALDLIAAVDALETSQPVDATLPLPAKAKLRLSGFSGKQVDWLDDYYQSEHRVGSFGAWRVQIDNTLAPCIKRVDKAATAVLKAPYPDNASVYSNILMVNCAPAALPKVQAAINAVHHLAAAHAAGERASLPDIKPLQKLDDVVNETTKLDRCFCGEKLRPIQTRQGIQWTCRFHGIGPG